MTEVDAMRRRFVQTLGWYAVAFAVPLLTATLPFGRVGQGAIVTVTLVLAQVSAWLARRGRGRLAAVLVSVTMWIAMYWIVLGGDGMSGTAAAYLVLVPLLATISGGTRVGAITLAAVLVSMPVLMWIDDRPAPEVTGSTEVIRHTVSRALLVTLVGAFAVMLVRGIDRLNRVLDAARAQADHANEAKSRLLAHCSHDLRTPLHAVQGYTALLAEDAHDAGRLDELTDLARVDRASNELLRTIDQVLSMARLERTPPRATGPVDLASLLDEVYQPCVETSLDLVPFDPVVDAAALRSLLHNLAVELSCQVGTGTATIHVAAEGRALHVVADPGAAPADRDAESPFEPFRDGRLELALCERLAVGMGGSARAEPDGRLRFVIPA